MLFLLHLVNWFIGGGSVVVRSQENFQVPSCAECGMAGPLPDHQRQVNAVGGLGVIGGDGRVAMDGDGAGVGAASQCAGPIGEAPAGAGCGAELHHITIVVGGLTRILCDCAMSRSNGQRVGCQFISTNITLPTLWTCDSALIGSWTDSAIPGVDRR